jgi:hypothetical protein
MSHAPTTLRGVNLACDDGVRPPGSTVRLHFAPLWHNAHNGLGSTILLMLGEAARRHAARCTLHRAPLLSTCAPYRRYNGGAQPGAQVVSSDSDSDPTHKRQAQRDQ